MRVDQYEWDALIAHRFSDAQSLCYTVRRRVKYQRELRDVWQQPWTTWERGAGDCEDFALLVRELAMLNGWKCDIVVCFAPTLGVEGHAVAVGQKPDGQRWISSNGHYEEADIITRPLRRMFRCHEMEIRTMVLEPMAIAGLLKKGEDNTRSTT